MPWLLLRSAVGKLSENCWKAVGKLLRSKGNVAEELKVIVAMMERQSGRKVQTIRSDNGTEFVNGVVEAFCCRNGIQQQTTVPYMPEQNGIAERAIAVYFGMVRSMIHSAKMDLHYWGEAFMYAVHI
ncbi:hypothetical protein PHLCEN_2v3933 [Hermanssonia centrifuga]|uniref:Integrase catalytic domain-containing protein n=1 Tax=Hermanssonia centrifuga TaxID=98765 RepID=A0A2R6QB45_9APHY|nr:hypothetical protein PHLCEN_2v3933 [Hermanssonia centrifuga]